MKAVSSVSFSFFVCLPHREVVVLQDRSEDLYSTNVTIAVQKQPNPLVCLQLLANSLRRNTVGS